MGTKTMRFSNMEGDEILVAFTGSNVADGEMPPATSPVVLQMDGSAEYAAVKYTTATVTTLCDGVQHLDLFSLNPLDTKVEITNGTTDTLLFLGYVTPNSFNQVITGINDTLAIECVDCLGIAKFMPYTRANEFFTTTTLGTLLLGLAAQLGARSVLLSDFVRLMSGDGQKVTSLYQLLELSESYFYSSATMPRVLPDGSVSFDALALTVYDILELVAQSLRATWVQYGGHLLLLDYVTLAANGALKVFALPGIVSQSIGTKIALTEESIAGNTTISVLPRYSLVSLDNKECEGVKVLPDVFNDGLLFPLRSSEVEKEVGSDEIVYNLSQVLGSTPAETISVFVPESTLPTSMFVAHKSIKSSDKDYIGAVEQLARWNDRLGGWTKYLRLFCPDGVVSEDKCLFSVRVPYRIPVVGSDYLGLKLSMSAAFATTAEKLYPTILQTSGSYTLHVAIRCGGYYLEFGELSNNWVEQRVLLPLTFAEGGEWRSELTGRGSRDLICDNVPGGDLSLEIWATMTTTWRTCYIKELSMELATGKRARIYLSREPETLYQGSYEFNRELDTVKAPLRFGFPMGERPFSTRIDGEEYATPYGEGGSYSIGCNMLFDAANGGNCSMLDRVKAMANFGDGFQWDCTLCDAHNDFVAPYSAISSPTWKGNKVIAGYERNLSESTINVTLL